MDPRRAILIDPGDTRGLDEFLRARMWRPHPSFIGLWNRDGGEYQSAGRAAEIEREEQRARDLVKSMRAAGSDDEMVQREIRERRAYDLGRSARAETKEYAADGDWGIAKDPAAAAERSRTKL